ncbi:hypothetical protein V1508DRAFT_417081 [Lipomyces doorenjongii]|uniref:uncharacterized protein n=1 Tax=Lipomyces doorenjongii TaxID=383834 RepID=UPI0034CD5CDB
MHLSSVTETITSQAVPATQVIPGDTENLPVEASRENYPGGGKEAWRCLLGSFLLMIPSFGFQTATASPVQVHPTKMTDIFIQLALYKTISAHTSCRTIVSAMWDGFRPSLFF